MVNRNIVYSFVYLLLNFIGGIVSAQTGKLCSTFCLCDTWLELQRGSCTGRHLYSIHTGVPNSVQALDLSNNSISLLNSRDFANEGLTKLKYLNLSGNVISEISLNAFDGLSDLVILDLSKNHLYYVLSDVFAENKNLRILKLSTNNFNAHVPKLRSKSLTELWLDSCQISHLPLDTFYGLPHIRNLDLSSNLMIQINGVALQTLHFLTKLSLDGNPWSCNNVMYDLQAYLIHRNVEFSTVCGKTIGPKKFEKMIVRPVKSENHHHQTITNKNLINKHPVSKINTSYTTDVKNLPTCKTSSDFIQSADNLSSFWFLVMGFIVGTATGTFVAYVCLNRKRFCRTQGTREMINDDSQRLSLLWNQWNFQDPVVLNNNEDLVASCPGTPPPPYRDVILRPGLYR